VTDQPTPAERDGDSLLAILDQLHELVTSARAMPMSASALVNRAEVLDLLTSARDVVPNQINEADRLMADADALLDGARAEAGEILARAQEIQTQPRIELVPDLPREADDLDGSDEADEAGVADAVPATVPFRPRSR